MSQDDTEPTLSPRNITNSDPWQNEAERKDLDQEIDAVMRSQHQGLNVDEASRARLARMQQQYLEISAGATRVLSPFEMMDWATEYMSDPEMVTQYPSLFDVCDGEPAKAAAHVVHMMKTAETYGGQVLSIGMAAAICERALALYITESGDRRRLPTI